LLAAFFNRTKIEWLPCKSLTQKKDSNTAKPAIEIEKCDSFFNFFNLPEIPKDDMDVDEEVV
jgi:hypothetical protein